MGPKLLGQGLGFCDVPLWESSRDKSWWWVGEKSEEDEERSMVQFGGPNQGGKSGLRVVKLCCSFFSENPWMS